ncbi:MAG: Fic family protein [Oscillospiraceae bacterium]|nr:Fic family protein [Oscillospiraceae bacterium]
MRKFDYSFLENGLLPAQITNKAIAIGELRVKGQTRKEKFPDIFTKLESIARVQSVKGSNAIEGIITTDKRIEEIVNKNSAPLNHDELEIAGYRDTLNLVYESFGEIQITEQNILNLHAIMQRGNDRLNGGEYKQMDNTIIAVDSFGNRSVRFKPIPASETKFAMEQMILAYLEARDNDKINQLFLIPCFVLDFLCIHPFIDGNGRMSRLLSLLLLYQNGFDAGKYVSFEEQINNHKAEYYDALLFSSTGWHDNTGDYFPFMQNFISTLYMCYKELDMRFGVVGDKKTTKKKRIEAAIFNSILPISKKELCHILPDVSENTVASVLNDLMKSDVIEKVGTFKDAKYKKKK